MARLLGFLVAVALLVFGAVMLVNAARARQWGWFVAILLFWPVAIAYLLIAYVPGQELRERERQERERQQAREAELGELRERLRRLEAEQNAG